MNKLKCVTNKQKTKKFYKNRILNKYHNKKTH